MRTDPGRKATARLKTQHRASWSVGWTLGSSLPGGSDPALQDVSEAIDGLADIRILQRDGEDALVQGAVPGACRGPGT